LVKGGITENIKKAGQAGEFNGLRGRHFVMDKDGNMAVYDDAELDKEFQAGVEDRNGD
jgi:hypothetical protein